MNAVFVTLRPCIGLNLVFSIYSLIGINLAGILGDAESDSEGLVGARTGVHRGRALGLSRKK